MRAEENEIRHHPSRQLELRVPAERRYEFVIRNSYELIFDTMREKCPRDRYVFEASGYTIEQMARSPEGTRGGESGAWLFAIKPSVDFLSERFGFGGLFGLRQPLRKFG